MADLNIPGAKIVGYEGLIGVIATLLIIAPIVRLVPGEEGGGFHEDILDTWTVSSFATDRQCSQACSDF